MIAGLIDKRKDIDNQDILIILGAKTETENQFIDLLKGYKEFNDYGIIYSKNKKDVKDKNIYILSQELIKLNKKDKKDNFNDKFVKDYKELFKKKNIDIYFDEIHNGGSTDKSQSHIINALINNGININISPKFSRYY